MPRKVCEVCKIILGNAYKFKQICKRADTLLKMFPMTGKVPPKIHIPQEMLPASTPVELPEKPITIDIGVGYEIETQENSCQTDPIAIRDEHIEELEPARIISPPPEFSVMEEEVEEDSPNQKFGFVVHNVKILNKAKSEGAPPKQFKRPSQMKIERMELGKPKILNCEILNLPKYEEMVSVEPVGSSADGGIQIIAYEEEFLDEHDEWGSKREKQDRSDDGVVYSCDMCDRSFPLMQQLELHRTNHTRERNHPCDECDKSFFTKYDLAKHVVIHTKRKDYTCVVCNKSFSRSTLLYRHEKIHTDPHLVRHNCSECDRVYLNKVDFDKHWQTHLKTRPYECNYCDKRFAFKQGLERHETIHDVECQPFPCQYCDMRLPSAARLQRHLSSEHAGTRPFPCSKCNKRFMLSHHLYRHMRTAHESQDQAQYHCPVCEETFNDRVEFFSHAKEHAEETLSCPLCQFEFGTSEEVNEHIALHSESNIFRCEYCDLIYMSQAEVDHHQLDLHAGELCTMDDDRDFIVDTRETYGPRKRKAPASEKKDPSNLEFDDNEYLMLNEDQLIGSEIEGAAFVEYEEVEEIIEPKEKVAKIKTESEDFVITKTKTKPGMERRSYAKATPPAKKHVVVKKEPLPVKTLPIRSHVKVQKVKMSAAEVERLKKAGKIKVVNGEMIMNK